MKILFSLFISIVIIGCTEKTFNDILLTEDDTVVYSPDIEQIMTNHCISCHNYGMANGGVQLEYYSDVRFNTESGNLISRINNSVDPMPPFPAEMLSGESRQKISSWAANGYPEN